MSTCAIIFWKGANKYQMQLNLSRGWKVRSETEMQAWGARVLNRFFEKHPELDPLQIQKLNEEGVWFRDRHFTYLDMLSTGREASSVRKARQIWQAFPAVRASDARPRIPLDADIARRQTELRERWPLLDPLGIDIDEEVEKSFNGRPFDALDRLERQEQLFGPDGAFLEPLLKRELNLDDAQLEQLKSFWMQKLDPSLRDKSDIAQRRALLSHFFSVWPAYRPLIAAGINICEVANLSFNGIPHTAIEQLERQEKLMGPDGAFLEPYLKHTLKLDDEAIERLLSSWMQELFRRNPALRVRNPLEQRQALLQYFYSVWPAYREYYANNISRPSQRDFFHLQYDPRLASCDRAAVMPFLRDHYPAIFAAIDKEPRPLFQLELQTRLADPTIPVWNAILETYAGTGTEMFEDPIHLVQRNLRNSRFTRLIDEIQFAPPLRDHATVRVRIAYVRTEMPHLYQLLTEKSGPVADEVLDGYFIRAQRHWIALHPADARLSESDLFKRSSIHFLDMTASLYTNCQAIFAPFDSRTIANLRSYSATDMREPPPLPLRIPFFQLANALQRAGELPISRDLLFSADEKAILSRSEEIIGAARGFFPPFFKAEFEKLPFLPGLSVQRDLDGEIAQPRKLQILDESGHPIEISVSKSTLGDFNRQSTMIISSEEPPRTIYATSETDHGMGPEALPVLAELRKAAHGDEELAQLFYALRAQTSQNFENLYRLRTWNILDLFNLYAWAPRHIGQTLCQKRDGSYEWTCYGNGLLQATDGSTHTFIPLKFTFRIYRKPDGHWFCENPILTVLDAIPPFMQKDYERDNAQIAGRYA
jgi:hypothetical protein